MRRSHITWIHVGLLIASTLVALVPAPAKAANVTFHLYGSTTQGWGETDTTLTIPGPTLRVSPGDNVTVVIHSVDSVTHNWYLDANANGQWNAGEPKTADVSSTTPVTLSFTAPAAGSYTYRCEYHQTTMRGLFEVGTPATPSGDSTLWLYVGAGIAAVGVGLLAFRLTRKKA